MAQSTAVQPVPPAQMRAEPASMGAGEGEGALGAGNGFPIDTAAQHLAWLFGQSRRIGLPLTGLPPGARAELA